MYMYIYINHPCVWSIDGRRDVGGGRLYIWSALGNVGRSGVLVLMA